MMIPFNETLTVMTNFERNMRNQKQTLNQTRVTNALKSIDEKFWVERMNGYVFISVFSLLGTEIGIAPNGQMETTSSSWSEGKPRVFETAQDVVDFVEEFKSF